MVGGIDIGVSAPVLSEKEVSAAKITFLDSTFTNRYMPYYKSKIREIIDSGSIKDAQLFLEQGIIDARGEVDDLPQVEELINVGNRDTHVSNIIVQPSDYSEQIVLLEKKLFEEDVKKQWSSAREMEYAELN